MKTNKIVLSLLATAALVLSGCSDSFLQRDPIGSTIVQSQYEKLDNTLEGSLRGVYSMMYTISGSSHDAFGHRAIDMYGDLLCGDMALTSQTYGWFATDEFTRTRQSRSGYLWSYYYSMLHNVNLVAKTVRNQSNLIADIDKYGYPNRGLDVVVDDSVIYTYSEQEAHVANYYAQALTMRGYVYSGLLRLFVPTTSHLFTGNSSVAATSLMQYKAFPMYTELDMDSPKGLESTSVVYSQVEKDLTTAIKLFEAFGSEYIRGSKLEVDVNVARGMLAYSYLNKAGRGNGLDNYADYMPLAKQYAEEVINSGAYTILPAGQLTTNGFNELGSANWMWGQDVTTETASGLASFFGQVDLHSYSYAWAGDTKVIDKNLYELIPNWDGRKNWFRNEAGEMAGQKTNSTFAFCPDGKFFSAKSPYSTAGDDIDREWLSDNVFMRYEMMYLIAAEACYFMQKYDSAVYFLDELLSNRLSPVAGSSTAYASAKAELADPDNLIMSIYYNWRIEFWGEGLALQTFRRLENQYQRVTGEKIRRGANHLSDGGKEVEYNDETVYTFYIPASETNYNPNFKKDE